MRCAYLIRLPSLEDSLPPSSNAGVIENRDKFVGRNKKMKTNEKKAGFIPRGIIPAVITPLTAEGKFSEKAMRKLIQYLINGGVHGLFVVGTTGEFMACHRKKNVKFLKLLWMRLVAGYRCMPEVTGLLPARV
jgi:hypothetical protein